MYSLCIMFGMVVFCTSRRVWIYRCLIFVVSWYEVIKEFILYEINYIEDQNKKKPYYEN